MHRIAPFLAALLFTGCPPDDGDTDDTAILDPCATAPLPAPTDLNATALFADMVRVSWSASDDASGFIVQRSTEEEGPFDEIGRTINTSFDDTGLSSGASFYYVVIAANADGESCPSEPVHGATP